MRSRLRWLTAFALLAWACNGSTGPEFGALYALDLVPMPTLAGETLTVSLSYRSCSGNAAFAVEHRMKGGTAEVWLRKVDAASCGAFWRENRSFPVPPAVQEAASVLLLSPNENPIRLRPL